MPFHGLQEDVLIRNEIRRLSDSLIKASTAHEDKLESQRHSHHRKLDRTRRHLDSLEEEVDRAKQQYQDAMELGSLMRRETVGRSRLFWQEYRAKSREQDARYGVFGTLTQSFADQRVSLPQAASAPALDAPDALVSSSSAQSSTALEVPTAASGSGMRRRFPCTQWSSLSLSQYSLQLVDSLDTPSVTLQSTRELMNRLRSACVPRRGASESREGDGAVDEAGNEFVTPGSELVQVDRSRYNKVVDLGPGGQARLRPLTSPRSMGKERRNGNHSKEPVATASVEAGSFTLHDDNLVFGAAAGAHHHQHGGSSSHAAAAPEVHSPSWTTGSLPEDVTTRTEFRSAGPYPLRTINRIPKEETNSTATALEYSSPRDGRVDSSPLRHHEVSRQYQYRPQSALSDISNASTQAHSLLKADD
jgi:hypothetical protein